jgi:general secretion pathway protein A
MDYFSILDLKREPFSNSPDPAFFYPSAQHTACLQQLELAIRLRRGLNVVIGHVGTGKTTLCREMIRRLDSDDTISTCLMLDPGMHSDSAFLSAVVEQLTGRATRRLA